jgi:hypothetical protein
MVVRLTSILVFCSYPEISSYLRNFFLFFCPYFVYSLRLYVPIERDSIGCRIIGFCLLSINDSDNSSRCGFLCSLIRRWACNLVLEQTLLDCQS